METLGRFLLVFLLFGALLVCAASQHSTNDASLNERSSPASDRRSLIFHRLRGVGHWHDRLFNNTDASNSTDSKEAKVTSNIQNDSSTSGSSLINGNAAYLVPHNVLRASFGVKPLVWNDTIAKMAQDWADHLASGLSCNLQHGGFDIPNSDGEQVGQNLAMYGSSDGGQQPPAVGIKMWSDEGRSYSPMRFPGGCLGECGHFTQMVWRDTTSLGCASSACNGLGMKSTVWVCNYYPAGNIMGEMPF